MEIINKQDNQIIFTLELGSSLANAIRRYVGNIPTLAIDEVEIFKNDSALYDETIAHRIGLIPLKMEKSFNSKTEVKMNLKTKKEGYVNSDELSGDAKVIFTQIPITYLKKGQELEVKCVARLGKGVNHSKHSPGIIFYRNVLEVNIDKNCPEEFLKECPSGAKELLGKKSKVENPTECDFYENCEEMCINSGKDFVKISPTKEMSITVESFGHLEKEEIFKQSIEMLKKDLAEISKQIK